MRWSCTGLQVVEKVVSSNGWRSGLMRLGARSFCEGSQRTTWDQRAVSNDGATFQVHGLEREEVQERLEEVFVAPSR